MHEFSRQIVLNFLSEFMHRQREILVMLNANLLTFASFTFAYFSFQLPTACSLNGALGASVTLNVVQAQDHEHVRFSEHQRTVANTVPHWLRSKAAKDTDVRAFTSEKRWVVSFFYQFLRFSSIFSESETLVVGKKYSKKSRKWQIASVLCCARLIDWVSLHFPADKSHSHPTQKLRCFCHRNSPKVDVRTTRQT